MMLALLVLVTGIALQIAVMVVGLKLLERLVPESRGRSLNYLAWLMLTLLNLAIPCGVAWAFGFASPALCLWISGGEILLLGLGLFANWGNLVESAIPVVIITWIWLILLPLVDQVREQRIKDKPLQSEQVAPDKTSKVPSGR